MSAKLGKAPPANPSSPATPKKSSKVNTFESHQNLSFNSKGWRSRRREQWVVSSEWEKSKCCCSYSGKRLQCCGWGENVSFCSENVHNSQHSGVIAGILSFRHSASSGTSLSPHQANQAISVGPAANPQSPKVNGVHKVASPQKSHFLDASFKEAEVISC